jgi:cytochrome c peroxidase
VPMRGIDPGRLAGIELLKRDPFNAAGAFSDDPRCEAAERVRRLAAKPDSASQFKTPSLRNVAETAPYMHQGQLATLEDVVRYYSTLEGRVPRSHHPETILVPLGLGDDEQRDLVAFLRSLTGEPPDPSLCERPR